MRQYTANILRTIAIVELALGLGLFIKELNEYIHLPTVSQVEEQFGGLVDWFKYKESCYRNFFLYFLMTLTGTSFWVNMKLYVGLTHVLFTTLFFVMAFNLYVIDLISFLLSTFIVMLSLGGLVWLRFEMAKSSFVSVMKMSKKVQWLFFICAVLSCCLWLFI